MLKNEIVASKIKMLAKQLEAMSPPIGMPPDCILHDKSKFTKVHKNGRGRWKDKDGFLYEWDALHGEIEVYNPKGKHIDVLDKNGKQKNKNVEKGRKIDVK